MATFSVEKIPDNWPKDLIESIPVFDFTKLSAINTCPTWGIIRYGLHKTVSASSRAMALEAGEACHQVFAAVRLIDILRNLHMYSDHHSPNVLRDAVFSRSTELFGKNRTKQFFDILSEPDDERTLAIKAGLHILETSGFYDDPKDKRRTIDKLSEACIVYIDRYEFGKHIPYVSHDLGFIGTENSFHFLVRYNSNGHERLVRFYGRIDGVHCYKNNPNDLFVGENKTASRLNDAWEQSFETSHQVTGYIVAARMVSELDITRARITGLAIPQPRVSDYDGYNNTFVKRSNTQFQEWADWFMHTCEMYFKYIDTPLQAPKYTHSCNRYFRPCSFIPLCASDMEDREELFTAMEDERWSPLEEKSYD